MRLEDNSITSDIESDDYVLMGVAYTVAGRQQQIIPALADFLNELYRLGYRIVKDG